MGNCCSPERGSTFSHCARFLRICATCASIAGKTRCSSKKKGMQTCSMNETCAWRMCDVQRAIPKARTDGPRCIFLEFAACFAHTTYTPPPNCCPYPCPYCTLPLLTTAKPGRAETAKAQSRANLQCDPRLRAAVAVWSHVHSVVALGVTLRRGERKAEVRNQREEARTRFPRPSGVPRARGSQPAGRTRP